MKAPSPRTSPPVPPVSPDILILLRFSGTAVAAAARFASAMDEFEEEIERGEEEGLEMGGSEGMGSKEMAYVLLNKLSWLSPLLAFDLKQNFI